MKETTSLTKKVQELLRQYRKELRTSEGITRISEQISELYAVPDKAPLHINDLTILPESYEIEVKGEKKQLSHLEFNLLYFLATHPNRAFSNEDLLHHVWEGRAVDQGGVRVKKIGRASCRERVCQYV